MVSNVNLLEYRIRFCLDQQGFEEKPRKSEVIGISDRIAGYPVCISIKELMEEVTLPNANSFTPAIFKNGERSNETWATQQLFALDIDSGLTIEEAVKLSKEVNVIPVFIYSSFSHTEEHHKFRMIFLLNEEIHDMRVRNLIQYALRTLFPTADRNANDPARLLFGGKKVEFYSDSVISVVEILDAVVKRIKMGPNSTRDMKKFCEQTSLSLCNGYPHYKVIKEEQSRYLKLVVRTDNEELIKQYENEINIRNQEVNYLGERLNNTQQYEEQNRNLIKIEKLINEIFKDTQLPFIELLKLDIKITGPVLKNLINNVMVHDEEEKNRTKLTINFAIKEEELVLLMKLRGIKIKSESAMDDKLTETEEFRQYLQEVHNEYKKSVYLNEYGPPVSKKTEKNL